MRRGAPAPYGVLIIRCEHRRYAIFHTPSPVSLEKGVRLFQGKSRPSPTGEGVFPWKQALRVPQIAMARCANHHPIFRRSVPSLAGRVASAAEQLACSATNICSRSERKGWGGGRGFSFEADSSNSDSVIHQPPSNFPPGRTQTLFTL